MIFVRDPLVNWLNKIVLYAVKFMAILMTLVIIWSIADVVIILYEKIEQEPFLRIGSEHLLEVFSSFLTVLIAIEIFLNIIIYLTKNMFQVNLVIATALTAVARKVIVIDYSLTSSTLIYAIAAIILSVGVAYWLTSQKELAITDENDRG
jgi:uncharacterized membrane protein (DUF373 family)